jgi:hypothetical protein
MLHELCIAEVTRRECPLEGRHGLMSFIRGGVVMATTAYAHLPDQSMKILIALWTACFLYVDDKFLQDLEPVYEFQDRLIRGIPQEDPTLEAFVSLTREISQHLHRVAANLFVTSTLNGVTGVLLEKEMQGVPVCFCPCCFKYYPQSSKGTECCRQISYVFSYHIGGSRSLRSPRVSSITASQFLHTRYA